MRYQGRLSAWNDDKGYGFVTPSGGGEKAFVHIKAFANRRRRPVDGDQITYTVVRDVKNRLRANDVRYPGQPKSAPEQALSQYAAVVLVPFACVVVALALLGKTPLLVPLLYVIASCTAFMVYGFDKSAAMNNRSRIPESTLHLLSVLGGWPGALVAQQMFRHKSKKTKFRAIFWLTMVLNCGALAWSATESGASFIHKTLGVW